MSRKKKSQSALMRHREKERQSQSQQMRLMTIIGVVFSIVAVLIVAFVFLSNRGDDEAVADVGNELAGSASTEHETASGDSTTISCPGELLTGERPLAAMEPAERAQYYSEYPEMILQEGETYHALIQAEPGNMCLRLFAEEAPLTVNSFVFLATQGFYDGVTFHRVLEGFMAQGGDPTGTGMAGPGYQFVNETDTEFRFDKRGILAMANAGADTNGSQFFITFVPTAQLNGGYSIFGELVSGDETLSAIRLREPNSDPNPGDAIIRLDIYTGG